MALTTASAAVLMDRLNLKIPQLLPDPRMDAAAKVAVGVLLVVLAAKYGGKGIPHAVLVGAGVSIAIMASLQLAASMRREA